MKKIIASVYHDQEQIFLFKYSLKMHSLYTKCQCIFVFVIVIHTYFWGVDLIIYNKH